MTKSARYYYDAGAIREDCKRDKSGNKERHTHNGERGRSDHLGASIPWEDNGEGRNKRSVWTITTKPFSGAHFAVMPPDLVEPCILAGSKPGDLVLDPFAGAGTVLLVAAQHDRRSIGVELSPEYAHIAHDRLEAWRDSDGARQLSFGLEANYVGT